MELEYLNKHPNFKTIVEQVVMNSHLQKLKILKFHKNLDKSYFDKAEEFSINFKKYLENEKIDLKVPVKAYLKMCADMMISHLYFYKHNKYPISNQKDAFDKVYDNKEEMRSYVFGIAISQFLWPTHYAMHSFFIEKINNMSSEVENYLEIGCGHGLFLAEAIKKFGKKTNYDIIDISKTSIEITQSIINFLIKKDLKINYFLQDVLSSKFNKKFDFIEMGEVLEHVDKPGFLLKKINEIISDKGHMFISTCVDCPTIDHVYHFKSVKEIEDMIERANFTIIDRAILPVEDLPMSEIVKKKITINYCALLKKK